jgi:hypothetical protein
MLQKANICNTARALTGVKIPAAKMKKENKANDKAV